MISTFRWRWLSEHGTTTTLIKRHPSSRSLALTVCLKIIEQIMHKNAGRVRLEKQTAADNRVLLIMAAATAAGENSQTFHPWLDSVKSRPIDFLDVDVDSIRRAWSAGTHAVGVLPLLERASWTRIRRMCVPSFRGVTSGERTSLIDSVT